MASSIQEENIYVTLLSNNSMDIYKNTPNTFTNLLTQSLNLDDHWVVGLSDISFSLLERNNQNIAKRRKRNTISNVDTQAIVHGKTKILKHSANNEYEDIKLKFHELLESSNDFMITNPNLNNKTKLLNKLSDTPKSNVSTEKKDLSDKKSDPLNKLKNDTSQTNLATEKKVNEFDSYTSRDELENVEKDSILTSTNHILHKSLTKFSDNMTNYFTKVFSPDINEIVFIYTDIIKPRHVGNKKTKCLKIFSISTLKNYIHFNRIEYFPIESYNINNISIMIRNDEGGIISLNEFIPVYCTLHFKKYIK